MCPTPLPEPCVPENLCYWSYQCIAEGEEDNPENYFPFIQEKSLVFNEIEEANCDFLITNANSLRELVMKHTLALWLNVASGKLSFLTQVYYPQYTNAYNVGDALVELENLIINNQDIGRALIIAESLNNGIGLYCQPTPTPEPTIEPTPEPTPPPEPTPLPEPCTPERIFYWKSQCINHHYENPEDYFPYISNTSFVFDEVAPASCAFLLRNPHNLLGKTLQQTLTVWLNVASGKLSFLTQVYFPEYTNAYNVGDALYEIETLILNNQELRRALIIARAINNGSALYCQSPTPTPEPTPSSEPCHPRKKIYWKRQCMTHNHENPEDYFFYIKYNSNVFNEIGDASCDFLISHPHNLLDKTLMETLVVWLNIASGKISFLTKVHFPPYTNAYNVGDALYEIENLILNNQELNRAKIIAKAINNGSALDCQ